MSVREQPPVTHDEHPPRRTKREQGRTAAVIVLALLVIVFAVLNLDEVSVNWIVGSGRAPLIVVIVVSLLVGILITYVAERRVGRRK